MASTPEFNSSLSLESDWSESDSGEEDLFRDFSDQIASAPMRRLPVGYTQPGDDSGTALPMGSIISGQVSCPFPTRDMPYQSFADWVLLKLATPSPALQNGYVDPRTGSLVMIEHIQPTMPEPGTEVYVLAGSQGTLMATVGQSLIRLHLHDLEMSVTQICLQKPLSRGTSGSWVVWEQSVIGYVVAGQELMPLAYIIPFRAFLESAGGDFAMAQIALRPPRVLHASDRTTIAVEEPDTTQIVRSSLRTETQAETLATHASPPTDPPSYHQPPEMSQKDQLLSRLAQQGIKASLAHTNGYQDQQVDVASSPARPHQATKKRASTSSIPWPGLDDDELDALLDLPHHRRFPPRSSRTAPLPPSPSLFNPRRCLHCGSSSHDASCCPERLFAHH
ncbi:uncharacterized protein HMPREF1541_02397 [Cyphellophora europaea CBS 101466]|uniref:Uncharacterized protein n=1 Tax=Cyphellophora europaea (strain CBS 101466) TaxID=1220924 RepID=W2S5B0_CYPE1|nr:uncharacterized protein HMPREF1541_02397 [Cyphellophora europaea CBS 101466]ETN43238.1 hypothetical protein HMPREF1541_02397 [Cyphellophora europaea CBS 101466]